MPLDLRQEVLSILGKQYRNLKKSDEKGTSNGPKRKADFYFKWLLRGDLLIHDAINGGKSPWEALEAYTLEVQKYIQPDKGFTFADIKKILRNVQRSIPNERFDVFGIFVRKALYVGGSVPNGRGFWGGSDLDLSSRFPFGDGERKYIENSMINSVKELNSGSRFHTHLGPEKWPLWQIVHPIIIRVTPEGLEMLVFDPRNASERKPKFVAYRLE